MLLVCTQSQQDMEGVITTLFAEHNSGDDRTWKLLCRCNLEDFFWGQLRRRHGYETETPSLADFIITLFKSSFAKACGEQADLNSEAHLLFRRWKNDRKNQASFETLSRSSQEVLGIQHQLAGLELDTLIEVDYFEQIDRHIIQTLISQLCENTIPRDRARDICRRRRNAHWHEEFRHLYERSTMQRDCWAKSPRVFSAFQALPTGSTGISKAGTRLISSTGNSFPLREICSGHAVCRSV